LWFGDSEPNIVNGPHDFAEPLKRIDIGYSVTPCIGIKREPGKRPVPAECQFTKGFIRMDGLRGEFGPDAILGDRIAGLFGRKSNRGGVRGDGR